MLRYNKDSKYLPYVPAYVIGLKQEGGEIEMSEENMSVEEPQQDEMEQILMMAKEAVEKRDAEMALQVCESLLQYIMEEQQMMQDEEQE